MFIAKIMRSTRLQLLGGCVCVALASPALAVAPTSSSGLGQSWPNSTDVSTSPHWHVYLFQRGGVQYIQVNDLNGKVRAAVARNNGQFTVLPIGTDAQRVNTPGQVSANVATASALHETVYQDGAFQLSMTPQANGQAVVNADDKKKCAEDPWNCIGKNIQ